ncbi:MAG: hypothetical protein KAJ40_00940, partial [Alphaproteobacteria bacterium]|nr:hypothetical protein [Alphaproteobacteria bacterium]
MSKIRNNNIQKPTDSITILCCIGNNTKAAKEFTADEEGNIKKKSFSAGLIFSAYEEPVNSIYDVYNVLKGLLNESKKCCIRGKLKSSTSHAVYRRIHGENAAFERVTSPDDLTQVAIFIL